jgi:squalene-hopene/tetraprenyl-beta-curcumene cyclase
MVALHEVDRPDLADTVLRARSFLAGSQHLGSDVYRGGMGYDPDTDRAYADLSNSYVAYEAMRLTAELEDQRKKMGDTDLDWDAAIAFTSSLQNPDGGFIYAPGESKAGSITNAQGEVRFRSYGSMTYAGLLSLIYAEVDRDDPRVKSAFDWSLNHWSLEENPGMGAEGLYYFYNVLAKALATYGEDILRTDAGLEINWREAFIRKLVGLQRIDPKTGAGYWVNEEGRWWEQDPVLVTSYALIALEIALGDGE